MSGKSDDTLYRHFHIPKKVVILSGVLLDDHLFIDDPFPYFVTQLIILQDCATVFFFDCFAIVFSCLLFCKISSVWVNFLKVKV